MKLTEAQNSFKNHTLNPLLNDLTPAMRPARKLSQQQAYELYHQSYLMRLHETLEENFPGIRWLLGARHFEELSNAYNEMQSEVPYDLQSYGENFPDFLALHPATSHLPFMKDMGRFEWSYKKVSQAGHSEVLPVESTQELIRAEDFHIHFVSAFAIFRSDYTILAMWSHRHDPEYLFENLDWHRGEDLMLYKKSDKLYIQRIDAVEAEILQSLQAGASITTALGEHADRLSSERIQDFFEMLMKTGVIEDIRVLQEA